MPIMVKIKNFFNKRYVKISLLVIVVLAAAALIGYFSFSKNSDISGGDSVLNRNTAAKQQLVARYVDGVLVPKGKENLNPIGVMVENLSVIRPQAGLKDASVVYEALAEGGITRFLAIYATDQDINDIGPVRSSRDYYLDLVSEYNALYAHCGGSPSALRLIAEYKLLNLDQISGDHQYFQRKPERASASEHTLFTSTKLLSFAERDKKIPEEGEFIPWKFKNEADLTLRPTEPKKIVIDFSIYSYKVEYDYNRDKNIYLRSNGGEPHLDYATKEQLSAKNVVVQYVKTTMADSTRLAMDMTGEGGALVFQDGKIINATWKKPSREERTVYFDDKGKEISLNAGPIWIEIVPTDRNVEYN